MGTTRISFDAKNRKGFSQEVKSRVHAYFEENDLSKHADASMVFKTFLLFTIYFGTYALIITGLAPPDLSLLLCFVMGIGMAGIGFSVSHDALHGAYSSNKMINKILGLSFDLLGANGYIWKITHNVIHHTYTNIYEHDEDLEVAEFIRLSPNAELKPIHRIQHLLAFLAYSMATLFWVFIKDYRYFLKKNLGPYEHRNHPAREWIILVITKVIYYGYMLVIPALVLPYAWWQILLGFLVVHLTAGVILGVIFQLAHVVETTEHPLQNDEGNIENEWMIHQMRTTANFAHPNKLLSWYIGGLNYQIEHHLFPKVCSIRYPAISQIVREVAAEYDVPYNYNETLSDAIISHYKTLKKFGSTGSRV